MAKTPVSLDLTLIKTAGASFRCAPEVGEAWRAKGEPGAKE
jgi:hypothetical protein